jgi:hypothetical protein
MSVRSVLSHTGHPRTGGHARTAGEPTRHEWGRELALVLAGLLVYFGVRAATSDDAGTADAHARSLVHLEHTLGIAREGDLQGLVIVGGGVALTGLALASVAIHARERRAGRPPEAYGDGAAWSTHRC